MFFFFFLNTLIDPLCALELTHISRKWGLKTGLSLLALQGLKQTIQLPAEQKFNLTASNFETRFHFLANGFSVQFIDS